LAGTGALYVVDDTLLALQDLARAHVARLSATRIALTGSNGKTTTKELLAACLRAHHGAPWVLATEGNLNNHIGVPLTALRAEPEHKALVFEMGMNHLKEIELLASIVRPTVGLVTNMGTAHAGNFADGVEGVAQAKAELYAALPRDGVAVVNADDARCVREAQKHAKCRQLSFGHASWADVRLMHVADRETGGQELELFYGGKTVETSVPLEGRHNVGNAAGAVAAAIAAGVPFEVAARGLASTHAAHGRLERFILAGGVWLLDDTYNANPDSMEAALIALGDLAGERRKVVVLGEMRELGALAESAHRHIGAAVAAARPAALYACGPLGKLYGEGAVGAGFDAAHVTWTESNAELAPLVVTGLRDGDVVLVKGSRGARMEVIVNALRSARATSSGQGAIA
jgi:UDP-N-acetylmuramoyl-tripeptide--D-alanyl-D-alanine ligase